MPLISTSLQPWWLRGTSNNNVQTQLPLSALGGSNPIKYVLDIDVHAIPGP